MKEPESMEELIYFTRRQIGGSGYAKAWVWKGQCSACHSGTMGKPRKPDGSAMMRAKEYVCPECGHTEGKNEHEESLTAEIKYTCPKCSFEGEIEIPFKRKKVDGMDALVFSCQNCNEKILITKKMKSKVEEGGD